MHQMVSANLQTSRRWWVLAIVVSAQFMFGVDAFIVNVAIPTIASELHASPAEVELDIAIYLIAYATLIVTGGRLGKIFGTKPVFLAGVFGFTLTSLWCALAQTGPELIAARLAQGATAALMVPQVLATLHLLVLGSSRNRAFAIYGIVLGLAGAAGFLLGGALVTLDIAGLGWRVVFLVNVPFGLSSSRRPPPSCHRCRAGPARGSICRRDRLFAGLLCLIGPLLFGHDAHWAPWLWLVMARASPSSRGSCGWNAPSRKGGMPLVDLDLLADKVSCAALRAAFCFFFANLSFYLIMTIFMQKALGIPPLDAGMVSFR